MKFHRMVPATAAAIFVLLHPAAAEEQRRTVSVSGEAEVRVAPDEVIVQMSVESRNKVLVQAASKTNRTIAAVVALAKDRLNVPGKYVQTDYVQIRPDYVSCPSQYRSGQPEKCDPTEVEFYEVKRGIEIRLRDLDKFDRLLMESLKSGVTTIDGVEFRTTELRKYRDQARAMALKAAREKAQAAAETLSAKLGPVTTIAVDSAYWTYGNRSAYRRGAPMAQNAIQESGGGDEGAGLALGQISVSARVSATFALE